MATASADPEKLDKAAAAVPSEAKNALDRAATQGGLTTKFAQMRQHTLGVSSAARTVSSVPC